MSLLTSRDTSNSKYCSHSGKSGKWICAMVWSSSGVDITQDHPTSEWRRCWWFYRRTARISGAVRSSHLNRTIVDSPIYRRDCVEFSRQRGKVRGTKKRFLKLLWLDVKSTYRTWKPSLEPFSVPFALLCPLSYNRPRQRSCHSRLRGYPMVFAQKTRLKSCRRLVLPNTRKYL